RQPRGESRGRGRTGRRGRGRCGTRRGLVNPCAADGRVARMATTTKRKTKAQTIEEHALSYFEAVTARDLDAMIAHLADDVIEDITPVGILRGTGEVREFFAQLFGAFPGFEFTVEHSMSNPHMAAIQWPPPGTFRA